MGGYGADALCRYAEVSVLVGVKAVEIGKRAVIRGKCDAVNAVVLFFIFNRGFLGIGFGFSFSIGILGLLAVLVGLGIGLFIALALVLVCILGVSLCIVCCDGCVVLNLASLL